MPDYQTIMSPLVGFRVDQYACLLQKVYRLGEVKRT